jgi:hypothetical protein
MAGERFGWLTVMSYAGSDGGHGSKWNCLCDCGKVRVATRGQLIHGKAKSCGCFHEKGSKISMLKPPRKRLSESRLRTRNIWWRMLSRCQNTEDPTYKHYGGRGISVCSRWLSFENFLADMGCAPAKLSIDRIDNDGNYSPENCRWLDMKSQQRNKRSNRVIFYNDEAHCLAEWCDRLGLNRYGVYNRASKSTDAAYILFGPTRQPPQDSPLISPQTP